MAPITPTRNFHSCKNTAWNNADDTSSQSSSDSASTTEAIARLQQLAKDADPITLLDVTVNHIRQAIRSEADIRVPWLRISGTTIPLYELADRVPLQKAVDDIKAGLDDVLDLEFGEGRALRRDSSTSDGSGSDHDDSDGGDKDLEQKEDELYDEVSVQGTIAENDNQDNRDKGHLSNNLDDAGSENENASQEEDDGMDSPIEGLMAWESAPLPNDSQPANDTSSQDHVSDISSPPTPQNRHAPHPPTPPPSSQKPPKKSTPKKGTFLSNLTPSRLLNLFLPSPSSPTPGTANSQQRPAERTPSSPVGSPPPYHPNHSPRRSPTASSFPSIPPAPHSVPSLPPTAAAAAAAADEEEESSSEDELQSPTPQPTTLRPPRASLPPQPPRRSPRTLPTRNPRTSARLAQMIPPNLRTASSMGPFKTLPGPRVRVTSDRGRSVVRISAVSVGQKRSGSAGSVSSMSSTGSGGGGGGGGGTKRVRFEGLGTL
ncbi:MAG: hypothetical protein Q9208_002149 [Pyrenodesmia sp. 3 TL-2023]